jgi:hypothetical protein
VENILRPLPDMMTSDIYLDVSGLPMMDVCCDAGVYLELHGAPVGLGWLGLFGPLGDTANLHPKQGPLLGPRKTFTQRSK